MSTVTLGFQTNSAASVSYFDIEVPKDGKKRQLTDMLSGASNDGKPVKVPESFLVDSVQLAMPDQLKTGKVDLNYSSGVGSNVGVSTLKANTTNATFTSVLGQVSITASA